MKREKEILSVKGLVGFRKGGPVRYLDHSITVLSLQLYLNSINLISFLSQLCRYERYL
jgi:hypothetical protein